MRNSLHQHAQIAIHLTIFAFLFALVSYISYLQESNARDILHTAIKDNEKILLNIIESDGDDSSLGSVSVVLTKCERQVEFESLISRIDSLTKQEILSLQSMFDNCARYYPNQKALTISKFTDVFNSYLTNISALNALSDNQKVLNTKSEFEQLLTLEEQKRDLLFEQMETYEELLKLFASGKTTNNKDVAKLLARKDEIEVLLNNLNTEIDNTRSQITL